LQQRATVVVAILDMGGVWLDEERPAVSTDQSVAPAPPDLLTRVIASRSVALGGLYAMAVVDGGIRGGVPSGLLAVDRDECMAHPFEQGVLVALLQTLGDVGLTDDWQHMIDSTSVRDHVSVAG
jgi:hypothetical protein